MISLFEKPSLRHGLRLVPEKPPKKPRKVKNFEIDSRVHDAYDEATAAAVIGVSRQTLRNWRVGYKNAIRAYPPILQRDVHWFKTRKNRRGTVYYLKNWADRIKRNRV